MRAKEIAPGSILQRLYLKERVCKILSRRDIFVEVGAGNGYISQLLLRAGMQGTGLDLNASACDNNSALNAKYIAAGRYRVLNSDFFSYASPGNVNVVISCMVIEHLTNDLLDRFFLKAKRMLTPSGVIITFCPGSMRYWGVEDEIAGHMKRYELNEFQALARRYGMRLQHIAGLTYPIGNVLFPLSNLLVSRTESEKKKLSPGERTILSGNRNVLFKTTFPGIAQIVLNPVVLYPLHLLQKAFRTNKSAMVIYTELITDE